MSPDENQPTDTPGIVYREKPPFWYFGRVVKLFAVLLALTGIGLALFRGMLATAWAQLDNFLGGFAEAIVALGAIAIIMFVWHIVISRLR